MTKPTTTSSPPRAATIGQMLGPGTGLAAADSVSAAGSMADTSASRVYMLTPARKASATAALIRPTVPSDPSWAMP